MLWSIWFGAFSRASVRTYPEPALRKLVLPVIRLTHPFPELHRATIPSPPQRPTTLEVIWASAASTDMPIVPGHDRITFDRAITLASSHGVLADRIAPAPHARMVSR